MKWTFLVFLVCSVHTLHTPELANTYKIFSMISKFLLLIKPAPLQWESSQLVNTVTLSLGTLCPACSLVTGDNALIIVHGELVAERLLVCHNYRLPVTSHCHDTSLRRQNQRCLFKVVV